MKQHTKLIQKSKEIKCNNVCYRIVGKVLTKIEAIEKLNIANEILVKWTF